jgi:large exoprotein involved in heme utilization and adhesion
MKTLLAAAENSDAAGRELSQGTAAAMGALELALADMAVDLEAIGADAAPGSEEWKRYLAGDRAVFARNLAGAIDNAAIDRITTLYREDENFHVAANAYMGEFEALLARAREGDGGGLLTSSILSADTGKIYLAIAYALGRL